MCPMMLWSFLTPYLCSLTGFQSGARTYHGKEQLMFLDSWTFDVRRSVLEHKHRRIVDPAFVLFRPPLPPLTKGGKSYDASEVSYDVMVRVL